MVGERGDRCVKLTTHFHIVAVEPYPYSLYDFMANTGIISLTFTSKTDHIVNECLLNYLNSPSSVEQSSSEPDGF
jgi:hypothetical protein